MGITVALTTRDGLPVASPLGYEVTADVTFDTDYAASGGETLDPNATLLLPKEATLVSVSCSSSSGFVFDYDITNSKIVAYWVDTSVDGAPLAEVTAGANGLADVVCHVHAVAVVR